MPSIRPCVPSGREVRSNTHGHHMIDFSKLPKKQGGDSELDPLSIFRSLPKPPGVNDLWDSQAEALRAWQARRDERDLVVKLNTGAGKTLVGLLIGEALRRETSSPVLYMCPTRQLADQALHEAHNFGLPAVNVPNTGLPADFLNGQAMLVSTYHLLFNGRSRFGLAGKGETVPLGGILADDAHASASILRDIFAIRVEKASMPDLFGDLVLRFRPAFERVHLGGTLGELLAGRDEGVLEVPYWAWLEGEREVRDVIQQEAADEFRFSLPLIRDHFPFCHAFVSSDAFTVTPLQPLVHILPSFLDCPRRVFMSATLADDGVLVRTFGADASSVARPITTKSVAGLGERMILAPSLSGLSQEQARDAATDLARDIADTGRGVVLLVPSVRRGKEWEDVGEVCVGDRVAEVVDDLNDPGVVTEPKVLVNRYDGIDLPQDACRFLVVDGKPAGATDYDLYRAARLEGHSSMTVSLAQRIEQGLGRGTRGGGDYCVVLLLGHDLVEWLGRHDTQRVLTPGTRAQVELGREIAGQLTSAADLAEVVHQCLDRDPEWKSLHASRLAESGEPDFDNAALVAAGRIERRALELLLHEQPKQACEELRQAAESQEFDRKFSGWLLQLAARAAEHAGDHATAEELQARAYGAHRSLMKPARQLIYEPISLDQGQAAAVVGQIEQYTLRSAVLERLDQVAADLHPSASANRFEEAIRALGELLGFASERPEKAAGQGPDNLWLTSVDRGWVIECKHQKERPFGKQDHGQLLVATNWFRQHYPDYTYVSVAVHPDGKATTKSGALGSATKVLTLAAIGELITRTKVLYKELAFSPGSKAALIEAALVQLEAHALAPRAVEEMLRPFAGE